MPRPANSAALADIAKDAKPFDFQGKVTDAGWHEACDIDCRQQSIWNSAREPERNRSHALSALKTNSAALGVVSNNVSNVNTPGYARRVVNQQTLAAGGQLMGVDIASIQRVVDQFLHRKICRPAARPRNMTPWPASSRS